MNFADDNVDGTPHTNMTTELHNSVNTSTSVCHNLYHPLAPRRVISLFKPFYTWQRTYRMGFATKRALEYIRKLSHARREKRAGCAG